jgi:outer membrane murein-binding lipoprotein Lpp
MQLFLKEEKTVWVTFCRDNDDVAPLYRIATRSEILQHQMEEEYREKRQLGRMTVVSHARSVCNVAGCSNFAEYIIESESPGSEPDYRQEGHIRCTVTCLCKMHHDRIATDLSARILELENRVDVMAKAMEQMYDLFEYRSDPD